MPVNQNLDSVDMMVNMGPQHPSTHGVFRMVLWVDGERITQVEPHIGYLHRGSEKICEAELYPQIVSLFDRMDYLSNFNNELVFCMAVEKLMGLIIPERAEYIRIIMCELNRITSHLMFYGAYGLDAGAITPVLYAFKERERIQSLFEAVSGARMMHNYINIGGVREDIPEDFEKNLTHELDEVKKGIDECDQLLSRNELFLARTKGVAAISGNDALNLGMSGPNLRASGILDDIRVTEPYSIYDRFEFGIPVGSEGDCWDRYYVRVAEMRESVKIIEQAIKLIEPGPVKSDSAKFLIRPPKGEVYVRAENPRGDFGVYLISDGSTKPYRVKVRAPSFSTLQALPHLLIDSYLADSVVILGSIDIILGEVDR